MQLATLTELLGWSLVFNIGILTLSTLGIISMRSLISRIHSRLFGMDEKALGSAYFQYLGQFKIAVIVFNLCPYLALKIVS